MRRPVVTSDCGAYSLKYLISNHNHISEFQNYFVNISVGLYTYTCAITERFLVFVLGSWDRALILLELPE